MFFFIYFFDKMIKIKSNKKHKAGLNTDRFMVGVVSHSQNPVDNKILSVNCSKVEIPACRDEFQICIISNFSCSFPDLSAVLLADKIL